MSRDRILLPIRHSEEVPPQAERPICHCEAAAVGGEPKQSQFEFAPPSFNLILITVLVYAFFQYGAIFAEYGAVIRGKAPQLNLESLEADGEEWAAINSAYFTIYYRADADLKAIERRLKKRHFYVRNKPRKPRAGGDSEDIAYRMDLLLEKAEEILDMRPQNMHVNVKIFRDQAELDKEYSHIFRERKSLKSFYVHKYNTIYTSESNISDSVIVHEMAHAVIDFYFIVLPPSKVQEMLASYVDLHLED